MAYQAQISLPKEEGEEIDKRQVSYVIQVRATGSDRWQNYASDNRTCTLPDGTTERKPWREWCAQAVWDSVKGLMTSTMIVEGRSVMAAHNLESAQMCLAIIHRINPSGLQWRIAERTASIRVTERPVDHRQLSSDWLRRLPWPEDDPVQGVAAPPSQKILKSKP